MANPSHAGRLAEFAATVQRRNRLVAIPAAAQRESGLCRRWRNHLVYVSIRRAGKGRWNRHYFKLTYDNEFSVPTDVERLKPGSEVQVRIHAVIADAPARPGGDGDGAGVLLRLAGRRRAGWRSDGSANLDRYLNEGVRR